MTVGNDMVNQQLGQVIQAMAAEAGFDVRLPTTELATLLSQSQAGNSEITMVTWSGRVDPDGNVQRFLTCRGGLNDVKYLNPDVDALLNGARAVTDQAERKAKYAAALKMIEDDKPITDLDFEPRLFGAARALHGFVPHPDGMIRLRGVTLDR